MAAAHLIVVPYELDRLRHGVGKGPERLLEGGAAEALGAAGLEVETRIVELDQEHDNETDACFDLIGRVAGPWRRRVATGRSRWCLGQLLPAALGVSLAGLAEERLGVVWFDAPGGFNSRRPPSTGISMACRWRRSPAAPGRRWPPRSRAFARCLDTVVVLAGARAFDPPEERRLDASAISRVSSLELAEPARLTAAIENLRPVPTSIYLHLDLDVLDSGDGEVNVYSAAGGVSEGELEAAVAAVLDGFEVRALSLTAFDPERDRPGSASRGSPASASAAARAARTRRAELGLERRPGLVAVDAEDDPLEPLAGVEVAADLLDLDPRRLGEREAADAGAEGDQRERRRAELVGRPAACSRSRRG